MEPQVVRYSDRPELWDSIAGLPDEVWPEYNQHGETLNHYWAQLYDVFPEWQFVLYDPAEQTVLAEGQTIPLAWDGTDSSLGPGIDATIAAAFGLRAAGGQPTAVSALAAKIPPRHQGKRLSAVLLTAMAGLALENMGACSATRQGLVEHMFDSGHPVRQGGRRDYTRSGTIPGRTAYFPATMEDDPVGQKTVRFSDLSGQLIMEDDAPARIVIHEHPDLADSPVEIEALAGEASAIEQAGVPVAIVDLYFPGDDQPRRVALEADAFDKLATDKPMAELLSTARPARRAPRSAAAPAAREDRINYGTLEHAGKPHKGRTTDAEKRLVQAHLDEINERLAAQNLRTISLSDPEHVERYGLEALALEQTGDLFQEQAGDSAEERASNAA